MFDEEKKKTVKKNELTKTYLRRYSMHKRKASRIEAELEEIRSMKMNPSINHDGMPRSGNQSDFSEYAAEIDELENERYLEGVQQVKAYKEIVGRIKNLQNENESDVLFYRYIKNMEFWDIANAMGFCERWIHTLHGRALKHLEIDDLE